MRGKNKNSIEERGKLPQLTTMNVIDGQAGLERDFSLIFYSLTINNILNIIVMLILVGTTVSVVINSNLLGTSKNAVEQTKAASEKEKNAGGEITIENRTYTIDEYEEIAKKGSTSKIIDKKEAINTKLNSASVKEVVQTKTADRIYKQDRYSEEI